MYLNQLKLSFVRNLEKASLDFSPHFNWIYGKNGSGKTSLLESIYLLSTGRSFKTRYAPEFIQKGQVACITSGTVSGYDNTRIVRLGIERHATEGLRLRVNEQPFDTLAEWVKLLPIQLINVDSYQLLNGPPKPRRQFLDWPMFHVEHSFFLHLQRYRRALKQRNAALRGSVQQRKRPLIELWDSELAEAGEAITAARQRFVQDFNPLFVEYLNQLLGVDDIIFDFKRGWHEERSLAQALSATFERDLALGYTSQGPHRADFRCYSLDKTAVETKLSRGQLKLFISALYLARSAYVRQMTTCSPVCLLDDLCSELDKEASYRLLQGLWGQRSQIFITSIDKDLVLEGVTGLGVDHKMFHVEHGNITGV